MTHRGPFQPRPFCDSVVGFSPFFVSSLPGKEKPRAGSGSERSERAVASQSRPLTGVGFGKGPGCLRRAWSRGKRHRAEHGR